VTRWKLTVEYDGGPFMGWQRQDHGPSVQRALEEALERMTGERASFTAAGRTDAGVHALAMAAHVDIARDLTPHRLREGLNALLRPNPVSVLAVESVADDWHARFSCLGRRYRYRILSRRAPPALDRGRVWHIAAALDAEAMSEGAAMLVGRHDFTTFRSAHCQSDSPVKTLDRLEFSRVGVEIILEAPAAKIAIKSPGSARGSITSSPNTSCGVARHPVTVTSSSAGAPNRLATAIG
jgi:tRNA pseudouridine38-40 synthase